MDSMSRDPVWFVQSWQMSRSPVRFGTTTCCQFNPLNPFMCEVRCNVKVWHLTQEVLQIWVIDWKVTTWANCSFCWEANSFTRQIRADKGFATFIVEVVVTFPLARHCPCISHETKASVQRSCLFCKLYLPSQLKHCVADSNPDNSAVNGRCTFNLALNWKTDAISRLHPPTSLPPYFSLTRHVDGTGPSALLWVSSLEWKTSLHNRWQPEMSLVRLVHAVAEFPRQDSLGSSETRASGADRVLEISFRWLPLGPRQVQMLKRACLIQSDCALMVPTHWQRFCCRPWQFCTSRICQPGEVKDLRHWRDWFLWVWICAHVYIHVSGHCGLALCWPVYHSRNGPHQSASVRSNSVLFGEINDCVLFMSASLQFISFLLVFFTPLPLLSGALDSSSPTYLHL